MVRFLTTIAVVAIWAAHPSLTMAQDEPSEDYTMHLTSATGAEGSNVIIEVLLDVDGDAVQAWCYGVCHDEDALSIVDAVQGSVGEDFSFIFAATTIEDNGVAQDGLLNVITEEVLPVGDGYQLGVEGDIGALWSGAGRELVREQLFAGAAARRTGSAVCADVPHRLGSSWGDGPDTRGVAREAVCRGGPSFSGAGDGFETARTA